ncbi:MAG: 50S ribosome-binding GTPase, partial [Candidatus Krumholzibacteria bacterium]|nr:50S ribosome-binding GTPase [Candidatus Krumholzibacteria bacterium]
MSSSLNNPHDGPSGAYEGAVQRMEQFVRGTDCLQGIYANRDDFLLRLDSLSIQRKNLEGALLIVILGGTGVGKSTVINAIAGEEVARVSPIRPCTTAMTFYSHS